MIFFTDENFPYQATLLLQAFDKDNSYHALTDHFHKGTLDTEWIPRVTQKLGRKPIIVSGDGRILTNGVERKVLKDSDCIFVYMARGWTNTPWDAYAAKLIKAWPEVISMAKKTTRQAIIEVTTSGMVWRNRI